VIFALVAIPRDSSGGIMSTPKKPLPRLLNTEQVAELFGVNPFTVRKWNARGEVLPPARTINGRLKWTEEEVRRVLEKGAPLQPAGA
jgi:hypothetical protein